MKKIISIFIFLLAVMLSVSAQNSSDARKILDKTSASLTSGSGIRANFRMSGKYGNATGSIAVKGNKFSAITPASIIWYDGKTQWTYMRKSQEVNITNPSASQQQSLNPYRFVNLYKKGYTLSSKIIGGNYQVHLVSQNKKSSIKEMYVTVTKSFVLKEVKLLQSGGWTTFTISNIAKAKLPDSQFRFNSKDYPNAEIIDLR